MMHRFSLATGIYLLACLVAVGIIVIRGDGPHPRITAIVPPNGDRYFPGGPAQISFSQPMDQASVERALQVSPGTQGQGSWFGTTLNFQPVTDWTQNVRYHVRLTGTVTDDQGRPLKTPFSFWFRVHRVGHLSICKVGGIGQVCERDGASWREVFVSPTSVQQFSRSPDGTLIAYTRRDASGLPHLFVIGVDGTVNTQLTSGGAYADSAPSWNPRDNGSVNYRRRRVLRASDLRQYGPVERWNVSIDGSGNAPL
ncbi:MAG: hypothetical protein PVSMB7_15700 [Chloroflexota bacterium]